jgi:hypothetical protein
VAVWPYEASDWDYLREYLTVDLVRRKFGHLVKGDIVRYECPNIRALNFVMTNALRGGVGLGLTLDPHGKNHQNLILDIDLDAEPPSVAGAG